MEDAKIVIITCKQLKEQKRAAADFLHSLKQKPSQFLDLEKWLSPEMQAKRMAKIVRLGNTNQFNVSTFAKPAKPATRQNVNDLVSRRVSGELSALIESSRIAFNELFEQKDNTFVVKTK